MEKLIMHPKTAEQSAVLKAVAKALKISFESEEKIPNGETIKAIEDARTGKTKKITNLKAFLDSI